MQSDCPVDTITLDEKTRHRRRLKLVSDHGIEFLLNLDKARLLRHGDFIELEDGRHVEVIAEPELLYKVEAKNPKHLVQLAWQLGNRHLSAQLEADHILIRQDNVIQEMLNNLGAKLTELRAPFNPEMGAYDQYHQQAHQYDHD